MNDVINIRNFISNLISIDIPSIKGIDAVIYHIKYITKKVLDYVNIDCDNFLYLAFNNVDGYIEFNPGKFGSIEKNTRK